MLRTLLPLAAALAFAIPATAQKAKLTVIHGIPGLPAPVEVFANGNKLFSFGFGDTKGPLELAPATYKIEVKLNGRTVLEASPTVQANVDYTAVAHLQEKSDAAPKLSFFVNDTTKVGDRQGRLTVRHLAAAPAVDLVQRFLFWTRKIAGPLSNGQEGKLELRAGTYYVQLNAAGTRTRAFGPVRLSLPENTNVVVHAVGDLAKDTFRLVVQIVPLGGGDLPKLKSSIQGTACGGKIGLSTTTPEFGKAFDVTLTGATKGGFGILHAGRSDSRFLFFRLPLDLGILGAKGCSLYQSTEMLMPVKIDDMGKVSRSITIPTAVARSFEEIHFQYSFVAPKANRLGLLLTDYATVEKASN